MEILGHGMQTFLELDTDCPLPSSLVSHQNALYVAMLECAHFLTLPHWLSVIHFHLGDDEVSNQHCFYAVKLLLEYFFFFPLALATLEDGVVFHIHTC